jgi:hypothetical protein
MGGGNSKSKTSQSITNKTINKNYMDTLNNTIMNSAVETIIKNASSCSSAVNINNSCKLSNFNVGGDFNFGSSQTSNANVNFNCVQANKTSADMATSMIGTMMAEMKALNNTDAAVDLNSASNASQKSGFMSAPPIYGGNSSSSTNTNSSTEITNETYSIVKNIFEQNLSNNFSVNTVNECIGKTNVSNSTDLSNIDVAGNAKINCVQTASVEQVQNCKQLSESISSTTQKTFQELGLTVQTESETITKTESDATSQAITRQGGLGAVGKGIADVVQATGNAFGSILGPLGLAFLAPFLSPICCICFVLILLICCFSLSGKGGSTQSAMDTQSTFGTQGNTNMLGISDSSGVSKLFSSNSTV